MDRASLERLGAKYRTLAELRARREEVERGGGSAFPPDEATSRRGAFRALAAEFPGSLRELDVTPAAALLARSRAIEAALAGGAEEPWMEIASAYHRTLREALAVKRWLAERRGLPVDQVALADFRAWHQAWPHRHGALPEGDLAAFLEKHLHPPRGRLQALVWEALAARFNRAPIEIEALVFRQEQPLVAPQLRHL